MVLFWRKPRLRGLHEERLKSTERIVPDTSEDLQHSGSDLETFPLSGWTGLRIVGEVDINNHDQFRRALAPVFASGLIAVHLDVSGLRFIDVTGTRDLITLMKSHPHLRLILHNPPASLQRIIALAWPSADIEIRIDNPVSGWPTAG
jgi:anti-anti-sigma factor